MNRLDAGDRVVISGHPDFEDGITGTVELPPSVIVELCPPGEWSGCRRAAPASDGPLISYYVRFDEPHDDGSGDGPYRGAEIVAGCLRKIRQA